MPTKRSKNAFLALLWGGLAAIIWAGFPVLTKLGIEQTLSPYDITALRYAVAGLLLMPVLVKRRIKGVGWKGALILVCGAGAPYLLIASGGLLFAPAGHFGIITPSCMLLFSAFGSWLWLGDKPDSTRIFGIAVIITGLFIIGWDSLSNHSEKTWLGDLMFVTAGCLWGAYTVASRYWAVDPLHAIAIVSTLSLLFFLPGYVVFGESNIASAPVVEVVIQAVFQGLLSAILALILYTRAVEILGAARGAIFGALVPGLALLLAVPILAEVPTGLQLMGVAVVTIGMLVAFWRRAGTQYAERL